MHSALLTQSHAHCLRLGDIELHARSARLLSLIEQSVVYGSKLVNQDALRSQGGPLPLLSRAATRRRARSVRAPSAASARVLTARSVGDTIGRIPFRRMLKTSNEDVRLRG